MKKIKAFEVRAEPTAKGTGREKLADCIDAVVNGWLEIMPGISDVQISHSAHTDIQFPSAVVVVTYEEAPDAPRRGRPPKE